jgi:hypothetical protein
LQKENTLKRYQTEVGMEFPYNEMIREWNGMFVHKSEYEAKHPQLEVRHYGVEGHGLSNARPAREENEVLEC